MGRFRVKRSLYTRGEAHIHEMWNPTTGQLCGRVVLWAESEDVVPELLDGFLVAVGVLPADWRGDDDGMDGLMNKGDDSDAISTQ